MMAAVTGPAVGIGTTLLLHCDLVYAGAKTRLQLPFVNLGICPEFASSMMMPVIMGHPRAPDLNLLCDTFPAAKARPYRLIHAVLPAAADDATTAPHSLNLPNHTPSSPANP